MDEALNDIKKRSTNLNEDLNSFDKNYFWVSAGIFAFTVTFIKDIVDIKAAHWLTCLFISWIFLGIAVGIIIVSFFISAVFTEQQKIDPTSVDEDNGIIWRYKSRAVSIGSFLIGLLFLCLFIGRNFYINNDPPPNKQNNMPDANKTIKHTITENTKDSLSKRIDTIIIRIKPDTIYLKTLDQSLSGS